MMRRLAGWLAIVFLCLLASRPAVAATPDADLRARFDLVAVPGIAIEQGSGQPLTPAAMHGTGTGWDINWKSAPEKVTPLQMTTGPGDVVMLHTEDGRPLLIAHGHTIVIAADTTGALRRWPYFNYMLYCAACEVAGQHAQSYADWLGSPMPHRAARLTFIFGTAALWALFTVCYMEARRRGRAQPDAATRFFAALQHASQTRGADQARWNRAGFARPLAGLLTLLATMSFMVGAYFIMQWLLSNRVQPFPEADGLWRTTWDSLIVVAALFELGTNVACQKYFAQDKVEHPGEALANMQFYLWWAFFQRFCQVTVLGALAVFWLPRGQYAIYAPFVALFAIKGIFAIYALPKNICSALQRFDIQNLLDMAEQRVLIFLLPIPAVLLGRAWGMAHPRFGEAFGAAVGLGVGQLASDIATFAIGAYALWRVGVPLGPFFLAQFDWKTARRQFIFGSKIAIGSEPMFLLKSVEQIIIVNMLADFTAWLGIYQLLSGRLILLFMFSSSFFGGAITSISEAYSAGKQKLTQYYVARWFQFGYLFMFTILSIIVALGPAFIRSLGPQWERAIPYIGLALGYGVLFPFAWVCDNLQFGADRPGTNMLVMFVEQGTRLALFWLLVPHWQLAGIFLATWGGLIMKAIVGWTINHKWIVPFRLALWPTFGASVLAAASNWLLWSAVVWLVAPTSNLAVLTLMCVASALSFFLTFFVYGLAGGCDEYALVELAQAAAMATVTRSIVAALNTCAQVGSRWALIAARPFDLAGAAWEEAAALDATAAAALSPQSLPPPSAPPPTPDLVEALA